jgi:hypothetical protein
MNEKMTQMSMTDLAEKLFREFRVKPTAIKVNRDMMIHLATHRPGGGNSHQRRVWRRQWDPRQFEKAS